MLLAGAAAMLATLAGPGPSGLVLEAVSIAKAGLFTPRFMVIFLFLKIWKNGCGKYFF
jgi:hypothetical protein